MLCQHKSRKLNLTLIAMIAVLYGIFAATVSSADEDINTSVNKKAAPQIKEIPNLNSDGTRNFTKEVEKKYDFIGIIDFVTENGVTVGENSFKFAPNAQVSGVSVGTSVGLILNKQREIVLCEPYKKAHR